MNGRRWQELVRRAFGDLTRAPNPQLAERIGESLRQRAGAGTIQGPSFPVPPAALVALLVVIALVTGAVLEGPAVARGVGGVAGQFSHLFSGLGAGRTAAVPSTSPSPTPRATRRPSPTPSAAAASPTPIGTPVPTPAPTPAGPPPPGPPAAAPLAGYTCGGANGGSTAQGTMATARVGQQSGYDRFVIQFSGAIPQYDVQPQGSATFGGTALKGSAGLLVTLHNATGSGSYTASSDFTPNYSSLDEAKLLSDSGGTVQWGIGMSKQWCYRAWTLPSPSRLIVDIQT